MFFGTMAGSSSGGGGGLLTSGLVAQYALDEGTGRFIHNLTAAIQDDPFSLCFAPEQNFASSSLQLWSPGNLTITDNYAANPVDGAITASRALSTSGVHFISQVVTIPAGAVTLSLWAQSNTGSDQTVSFLIDCGGFQTSPDKTITVAGGRISHTFTTAGGTATVYFLGYDVAQSAIDVTFYDARVDAGSSVGSVTAPTGLHMQAGYSTHAPSWSSEGLVYSSGERYMLGAGAHTFTEMSVHAVLKRSGALNTAGYSPILSNLLSSNVNSNSGFLLAGSHAGFCPFARWGSPTNTVQAYGATLEDGLTHHIAATYNGDYLRLYIDGIEMERAQIGAVDPITINRLYLGNYAFAGGSWSGDLNYVALYDVAHTKAQVQNNTAALSTTMTVRGVTINDIGQLVIFEGDSITSPRASPTGDVMYPFKTLEAITPRPQGRIFSEPGSIIADLEGVPSLARRLPEVKAALVPGIRNVFCMGDGHNDCASATFFDDYTAYISELRAYATANSIDLRIILFTILPSTYPGLQTSIDAGNAWIVANAVALGADSVCRLDTIPNLSDPSNTTYFADGTHLTALGHDEVVPVAQASIEAQLAA